MKQIDFSVFEGNFWKPEDEKDYVVELKNPRIEEKTFGESSKPRTVITYDVVSVNGEVFSTTKEFSTGSRSFIEAVKPIHEKAVAQNKESYTVFLRRKNSKEYTLLDYAVVKQVGGIA